LPQQHGLDFEIVLRLQNTDELWHFCLDCSFCVLSFESYVDEFVAGVDGLISGSGRMVRCTQGRKNGV
jgi:hypothetical protein